MQETPAKSKALRIFVDEVSKHLSWAHSVFDQLRPVRKECYEEGVRRFHTIKGGAGFFGLGDMADAAAQLEALLEETGGGMCEQLDEIRRSIEDLERCAASLPAAQGAPGREGGEK